MTFLHCSTSRSAVTAVLLLAALQSTLLPAMAQAQGSAWPNRPIRIIVPVPPGGGNDYLAPSSAMPPSFARSSRRWDSIRSPPHPRSSWT